MRATVATAIKYTIADPTNEYDDLLRPTLSGLLPLLKDESLVCHRQSCQEQESCQEQGS